MKQLFRLTLCVASAVACCFCSSSDTDDTPSADTSIITAQSCAATIDADAEGGTLNLEFTAAGAWVAASSSPSWCTISAGSGSGQQGSSTIVLEVAPFETGSARTSTITVRGEGYKQAILCTVTQQAAGEGTGEDKNATTWMDSYLSTHYLWNGEYQSLSPGPDLTLDYSTFLTTTLMRMTTNTLDKKLQSDGSYTLFSYVTRTSTSSATAAAGTRATKQIFPELVPTFGFASMTGIIYSTGDTRSLCVSAIYPDSPASEAGMSRGWWITAVNNVPLDASNLNKYYSQLISPSSGATVTLTAYRQPGETPVSLTLTARTQEENPVLCSKVFEMDSHKIGYLAYMSFAAGYDDRLADVFADFKAKGVNDMVLDLRKNSGGHVMSANLISTSVAGSQCYNKIFAYYRYNDTRMSAAETTAKEVGLSYDETQKMFQEPFYYDNYPNLGQSLAPYGLNLNRLYVLVTESTASASELVINTLRGIDVEVILIGSQTTGKNVGMEGLSRTIDGYTYHFYPITFQSYNAKGFGAYENGFTPDYALKDWDFNGDGYFDYYVDFGSETDPLLAKAIALITGTSDTVARTTRTTDLPAATPEELPEPARRPGGMIMLPRE